MSSQQVAGIARAVLAAASGYFVAQGLIDQDTAQTVSGALVTIAIAVWSVVSKRK